MPKRTVLANDKTGRKVTYWYPEDEDQGPAYGCPDFDRKIKIKLLQRVKHFIETGEFGKGTDKFKHIENQGKLHAIKCFQHRFIGVWDTREEFVILLCCKKKKKKYRPEDLEKAHKLNTKYSQRT